MVAFLARIESHSALERLTREGLLTPTGRQHALARLNVLLAAFDTVAFSADLETEAIELLHRHSLRSLDALQLASARLLHRPRGLPSN